MVDSLVCFYLNHYSSTKKTVNATMVSVKLIYAFLTLITAGTVFSNRAGDVASYSSASSSLLPLSLRVSSLVTLRPSVARGLFALWFNTPELLIGMDATGTTYEIGMASANNS